MRDAALQCGVPEIGLQILALWPGATVDPEAARALAHDRPQTEWDVRLDVLSIDEALDRLDALD